MADPKDSDRPLSDVEMFAAAAALYTVAVRASGEAAAAALAASPSADLEQRIKQELKRRDVLAIKRRSFDAEKVRLRQWIVQNYRGQQPLLDDILARVQDEVKSITSHTLSTEFLAAMVVPDFLLGPGLEFADEDVAALHTFLDTVGNAGGLVGFGSVAQA